MDKVNKYLKSVNNYSLTEIVIFNDEFSDLNQIIEKTTFNSLIVAGDGIFNLMRKPTFGHVLSKTNLLYTNKKLKEIGKVQEVKTYCNPKPALAVFNQIINIFKYIYKNIQSELTINLYFDTKTKKYIIDVPNQDISSCSSKYQGNMKYESNPRYVRYLQIHSHGSMKSFFSGVDEQDEAKNFLCFYGVVGNINSETNISHQFRIWNGNNFINLKLKDVFEIPENKLDIPLSIKQKLDQIIDNSKRKKVETLKLGDMRYGRPDQLLW